MTKHFIPYPDKGIMNFKEVHILPEYMKNGTVLFETSYEETKKQLDKLLYNSDLKIIK